jgi:hypothetical protein
MNDTMGRIILSNMFRSLITVTITFLVTKHVVQADLAAKLMRGETQYIYGTLPINLMMIVNVAVGVALPILFPLVWGIWTRITLAYKMLVAKAEHFSGASPEQIQKVLSQQTTLATLAKPVEVIKTVATGQFIA